MHISGQCHCGELKYDAEIDPKAITICHCSDCQKLSGSAFRANLSVPAAQFRLLGGTPKKYVRVAESGNRRSHAFCGICGTNIYACAETDPQAYSVRTGTINERQALRPNQQIWRGSAVEWISRLADLPARERD